MKIKIDGNELLEPEIQAVSLVKRGANRSPFNILKSDEPDNAGVSSQYPLGDPRDGPPPPSHSGGPYSEATMGATERYLRDRNLPTSAHHGAQAAQVGRTVQKHSLDSILAESWARVSARRKR